MNTVGETLSVEEIPDAVQPILAARRWDVRSNGALAPATYGSERWLPQENVAHCRMADLLSGIDWSPFVRPGSPDSALKELNAWKSSHRIPDHRCKCGFYGLNRTFALPYATATTIRGVVALYGKVIIAEDGYRAEKAKVHSLKVNLLTFWRPNVRRAAKRYGVPLKFFWPKITSPEHRSAERFFRGFCSVFSYGLMLVGIVSMPWAFSVGSTAFLIGFLFAILKAVVP